MSIPGIKHRAVTDRLVEECENNFGAMAVLDVEEFDSYSAYVTSSLQEASAKTTSQNFAFRALGSSFAAAYYPGVTINFTSDEDEEAGIVAPNHSVPASVAALGTIALNDADYGPYYAPMGLTRGRIDDAIEVDVKFRESDVTMFSDANVNIIGEDPNGAGAICILGQRTCHGKDTALDRINTRRMLIHVRRHVRHIARDFLMEPARRGTKEKFLRKVRHYLQGLAGSGYIESFRVALPPTPAELLDAQIDPKDNILINIENFKAFGQLRNRRGNSEQELKTIRANVFIVPLQSDEVIKFEVEEEV